MDNSDITSKDPEINLLELARQLWAGKWYILKIAGISMVIGLIIAFSIPREYTCTVKMAPEGAKSSITGNVSDLAAMAGINIGTGDADGINLTLYPDVVQSFPFMTELINIKFFDKELASGSTLYNYLDKKIRQPWWSIIVGSPFKLIDLIRYGNSKAVEEKINPYQLTKKQDKIFENLKKRTSIAIDKKTGVITAGITMQNPVISAVVADSLIKKLERFVIDYRTTKAQQDFDFALKMFADSKQKYFDAQQSYARYIDNNKNVVLESVLIEQERLKNEQTLTYSVYSNLAQQVEQARMKVQEQTPCVTVIEPARVPARKSNTSRLFIMIIFGLLGLLYGAVKTIYSNWETIRSFK